MMKHLLLLLALSVTAVVNGQDYSLPYVQNFDDTTIPEGWTQEFPAYEAQHWQFGTVFDLWEYWTWPQTPKLDENYAIIRQEYYASNEYQLAELISPIFNFSEIGSVRLYFTHSFAEGEKNITKATLSYRTGAGSWIKIKSWPDPMEDPPGNPETFNEIVTYAAGQEEVQFKWSLGGFYSGYWAIDNVTISEPGLTATWNGYESDNWHDPLNWDEGFVPNSLSDVIISEDYHEYPAIQGSSAFCKNITLGEADLTINSGYSLTVLENFSYEGSLFLDSDFAGSGSLIASSISGNGTTYVDKYMSQNRWYYISSPVSQSISSFLANNETNIPRNGNSRGVMDFNTSSNIWNPYFEDLTTPGNFESGKGYSIRISNYYAIGFNGSISTGPISKPLSTEGLGWNLVGNPYTSAIALNTIAGESNFLALNEGVLEPNYVSVYFWNGTQYDIINNSTWGEYASMGQGFFVKANPGGGNLTFNQQMQVHKPTERLKSGKIIPGIKIQVTALEKTISTDIKFLAGATTGLDVGYDAGILKADPSFAVFTRLVQDNNVEFALQCLPELSSEKMIIPVGVDFRTGGEITFTAEVVGLPDEGNVVLEDKLLNVFTTFDKATSKYLTKAAANAESTGRFFLHVSGKAQTTGIDAKNNLNKINAWMERDEIVISGITDNTAVAKLFDIRGSSVLVRNIQNKGTNRISVNGITSEIYMLQVIENGQRTGIKLRISKN